MKLHPRWPSPALVVASVALVVALGGTGYAALKLPRNSVGASQIKTDAVTSVKIRNGSLRMADFQRGDAPEGAPGAAGAPGAPGAPGARGPEGPAGSSAGYAGLRSDVLVDVYDKVIITKDLPAGKYILSATVDARGAGSAAGYMGGIGIIDCTIPGYHTASYYLKANDTYVSEQKSLSLHAGVTHAGGAVQLICSRTWNSVFVDEASLTAVKVDALG